MNATVLARTLGCRVRECRLAKGVTQKGLAESAGVSERLVRSLELGEAKGISLENLCAVLSCLGLELALADDAVPMAAASQNAEYSSLLARAAGVSREGGEVCDG